MNYRQTATIGQSSGQSSPGSRAKKGFFCAPLMLAIFASLVSADAPATRPAQSSAAVPTAPPRSLLSQINLETENLYKETRPGVVLVQMPLPLWVRTSPVPPFRNWEKLSPEVRRQLMQQWRSIRPPTTAPVAPPAADDSPVPSVVGSARPDPNAQPSDSRGPIVFINPPSDPSSTSQRDADLGARQGDTKSNSGFAPHNVGIVLDEEGHVLVPLYVEAEACANTKLLMSAESGEVIQAKFLGSDKQTNLTLLQAEKPLGKPVFFARQRPANGAMVMYISLNEATGRLVMWDSASRDNALVFNIDGRLTGIVRSGQFLGGASCELLAGQIIRYGSVKRASIGVIVSELRKDDPLRDKFPVLGDRAALHVDEVIPNSPAARAGVKPEDLLLSLAGEAVSDIPSFAAAIAAHTGRTELQILRGQLSLTITVNLQAK